MFFRVLLSLLLLSNCYESKNFDFEKKSPLSKGWEEVSSNSLKPFFKFSKNKVIFHYYPKCTVTHNNFLYMGFENGFIRGLNLNLTQMTGNILITQRCYGYNLNLPNFELFKSLEIDEANFDFSIKENISGDSKKSVRELLDPQKKFIEFRAGFQIYKDWEKRSYAIGSKFLRLTLTSINIDDNRKVKLMFQMGSTEAFKNGEKKYVKNPNGENLISHSLKLVKEAPIGSYNNYKVSLLYSLLLELKDGVKVLDGNESSISILPSINEHPLYYLEYLCGFKVEMPSKFHVAFLGGFYLNSNHSYSNYEWGTSFDCHLYSERSEKS